MKKLKIAVVLGDEESAKNIAEIIRDYDKNTQIELFKTPMELLQSAELNSAKVAFICIAANAAPVFIAAAEIKRQNAAIELVFCGDRRFAFDAFAVNAMQFLEMPVTKDAIAATFARYRQLYAAPASHTILISVNHKKKLLDCKDIYYIEVRNKHCYFHTTKGVLESFTPLSSLKKELPSPQFLECHRSFVVNLEHVSDITSDFVLANGDIVYISQTKRSAIYKEFLRYKGLQ